ncbi:MAG TPA: DUF4132 domain-containing protein [Lacunisphaera sp.]|nr:DUF4132 domain-containing protein [Lacunisphaera sp.]
MSAPSFPPVVAVPTAPTVVPLRHEIDLAEHNLAWVADPTRVPAPLPPAREFDQASCVDRLRHKVRVAQYGWLWDFSAAIPPGKFHPAEAEFWLAAMSGQNGRAESTEEVANQLAGATFTGALPKKLSLGNRFQSAQAVQCLATLMSTDELSDLLLDPATAQGAERWNNGSAALRVGFQHSVWPYLTATEKEIWRAKADRLWDATKWPADFYAAPAPFFFYGAMMGLRDKVAALVASWPDDLYAATGWDHSHYHCPQEIVFGLGSPAKVAEQFRRLKLTLNVTSYLRAFLAITRVGALDIVARNIAAVTKKEDAEVLAKAFACVHAPEAAPHMLMLALESKAPRIAREWLEQHPAESVAGLLPVAAQTGKLAEAAVDHLLSLKRRGSDALIASLAPSLPPEAAQRIRQLVLDVNEVVLPELPPDALPAWWREPLAQAPLKKAKPVTWLQPTDLPALTLNQQRLGAAQVAELLQALQTSAGDNPHPILRSLRSGIDADSLDAFGWKIFQAWLGEGAPAKDKWAFTALGWCGADRTVLKLAPMIREWPGEAQHQRAVAGLDVLRTIGTDTALMQINGIAQKVKFKGLKERAIQCMDAIAETRGMSRAQLEDRIVPDCGLDERGRRTLDFGPRQFQFILGPEMKPMVRYPDGAIKPDLPKPNAKDDAAIADATVAEWKLLKKQIGEVAKIQAVRVEQAMVTGRRWSAAEFDQLLVRHPLMVNLVRLMVWATYDAKGAVTATFRVTEDQTLADATDSPFTLPADASVGVLHPFQLASQPAVLEQWGQLFGDYEIVPPFTQLGRLVHRLPPEFKGKKALTHFASRPKLPAQTLVFGLEKLGWQRGIPQDGGGVNEHSKQFYGANVTAVINYLDGFSVGYWEGAGDQTIEHVFFVPGLYTPRMYPDHKNALPLEEVDPIALSEAINDCELLLAKAK